MSVQTTFDRQALYPVTEVDASDCRTPIDGTIRGENHGNWSRIQSYRDSDTVLLPVTGPDRWVGGFRLFRHDFDHAHEVTVYHLPRGEDSGERDARVGSWLVHWGDVGVGNWEYVHETFYFTPSLRDARCVTATLLTNIARADTTQTDWKEAVHRTVERLDLLTFTEYCDAHAKALTQHTPWDERREQIHETARYEWRSIREHRERLLTELQNEIAADEDRGYPVQKILPPTINGQDELTDAFVNEELTVTELETELETAWENTPLITFDEYIEAVDEKQN